MSDVDEKNLLARELRERSEGVGGHPIGIEAVKGRARSIRRRRNAVTGLVAAAILAVAVPAGLSATEMLNQPEFGPAHQLSHSPRPAPTPRPDGTFVLTTKGLPRGTAPDLPYVLGAERKLVTPHAPLSAALDLPRAYSQIAPVQGGWMAVEGGPDGDQLVMLRPDMSVHHTEPGGPLVLDRHGSRVLYVLRGVPGPGETSVVDAPVRPRDQKDAVTWRAPRDSTVVPVGYLADHTVVYQTEGEKPVVVMGTPDGRSVPLQGFLKAESASEANGLVAGMVSYKNGSSCSGVMDPQSSTTRLLWKTCRYTLHEFSPDGRFVIAGSTDFDVWGSPSLSVLDAHTGDPVVEFRAGKDVSLGVAQTAWEDADTVLADVVEGNRMTMVRAELSGRLEAATDSSGTMDQTLPFWFAEQPNR